MSTNSFSEHKCIKRKGREHSYTLTGRKNNAFVPEVCIFFIILLNAKLKELLFIRRHKIIACQNLIHDYTAYCTSSFQISFVSYLTTTSLTPSIMIFVSLIQRNPLRKRWTLFKMRKNWRLNEQNSRGAVCLSCITLTFQNGGSSGSCLSPVSMQAACARGRDVSEEGDG